MRKNRHDELDLSRIVYLVTKYKRNLLCLALAGLILGSVLAGVDYFRKERTPRHVITCSFAVVASSSGAYGSYLSSSGYEGYYDVKLAEDIAESVIFVTRSDRVLSAAIDEMRFLGISNDEIRDYMKVEQYLDTQIVTIELRWINANEGLSIVQSICDVVPDILIETLNLGSVSIVDYPKDTGIENAKLRLEFIPVMMVLLMGAYIVYRFLSLIVHPVLTNVDSLGRDLQGLDCIGLIPESDGYFREKPFSLTDDDPRAEYHQVRESLVSASYVIDNLVERTGDKCFYITSSEPGEGKTGVIAGLAIELSRREKKVLLIDMDTRSPALGSCFFEEVAHEHSLNAVYEGSVSAADAIISVSGTLDVLPARLEKERVRIDNALREQLKALFGAYDIILLDAPPVGVVSDVAVLNKLADKALMVMRFDAVWIETIRKNIEKLRKSGIETCGAIVTNVNMNYGSGYRTGYGSYPAYRRSREVSPAKPAKPAKQKRGLFGKKNRSE